MLLKVCCVIYRMDKESGCRLRGCKLSLSRDDPGTQKVINVLYYFGGLECNISSWVIPGPAFVHLLYFKLL